MKTWTKTAMAAMLVATSVGFGATAALARGGDCGGAGPHGGKAAWHHAEPGQLKARAEQHLAKLEQDLKLKPEQTAAWSELKSAVLAKADQAEARFRSMREEGRPATAVEGMQRMEAFARERADSLGEVSRAAESFYSGLDEAQKKAFDEGFRPMRMGAGRGMGGRRG